MSPGAFIKKWSLHVKVGSKYKVITDRGKFVLMLASLSPKDTHFGFHAHIPSAARLNSQCPTSVLHKQTQTGQIFSQVLAGGSRWSSLSTTWQLFSPLIPPHTSPNSAQLSTSFEPNTGTKPGHSSFCTSVGAELTLPLLLLSEETKDQPGCVQHIHEPRQKFLLPRTEPTSPSLVSLFPLWALPAVCFLW